MPHPDSPIKQETIAEMAAHLAYEYATQLIEGSCYAVGWADEDEALPVWWDTRTASVDPLAGEDVAYAVRYLERLGLIDRHAQQPDWVSLRDEGEGSAEVAR